MEKEKFKKPIHNFKNYNSAINKLISAICYFEEQNNKKQANAKHKELKKCFK